MSQTAEQDDRPSFRPVARVEDEGTLQRLDVRSYSDTSRDSRFRVIVQDGALESIEHAVRIGSGWETTGQVHPNRVPDCVRESIIVRLGAKEWDELVPDQGGWECGSL